MKKLTIELEVDEKTLEEWIEFVTKYPDIFMPNCCGYWLYGVQKNETGWLAWEHNDDRVEEKVHAKALDRWEARNQSVQKEGIKREGVGWYENADATDYDCVLQLALLGEIKYG